jgi:DNA-binding winged helix-turn-helix (wHTH) protein
VLFEFDDFVLDESAYELRRGGAELKVDPKVIDVLAYMLRRPGQLVTKRELVAHVWEGRTLSETVLTGAVSKLRKALGSEAGDKLIVNVYGRGYRFAGAVKSRGSLRPPSASTNEVVPEPAGGVLFVGRRAPLARIERALNEVRQGRGRILAVAGEPGIGKTELAEVSVRRASALGVPSAWGHCRAGDGSPPFWPIIQALRSALGAASTAKARDAVGSALSTLTPESTQHGALGAEAVSYRVFDIVANAIRALTEDEALVLVLDDLQWADAASLRFLSYLAPELGRIGLLVLLTLRNTETPPTDPRLAAILGHRNCEYFELERLTESEVAEYTALRLGASEPELNRAVFGRSEGNPFFMVELLRPFEKSGPPRADQLALSGPALDIVRQRIRRLSAEATSVLRVAAVIGRDFDVGSLGGATERAPAVLLDILESASAESTIVASSDRPGSYSFGHDLIRAVLLDDLSVIERARLHLAVASGLEHLHADSGREPPPELVHHLLSAVPLGNIDKAVGYALRSALAATYVHAHADAAALLRRALSAIEITGVARPRQRCELLLQLAHCERMSADSRFVEHLSEAVALGREHGFGDLLAEAGRGMSSAPGFIAMAGARDVLESADRALPEASADLRADVLSHLAWTAPYCFDERQAALLVGRAEALALQASSSASLAAALSAKLYFSSGPGSEAAAREISDRIDGLLADRPPLIRAYWSAQAEFSKIVLSLRRADAEGAEGSLAAFGAAARELKHAELEWHHDRAAVVLGMNRGRFAEAHAALQTLEDRAKELELFASRSICSADRAVLLRDTGGIERLAPFQSMLTPEEADCPCRLARKVRFLSELGATHQVLAAFERLSSESLGRLPRDRDYLATLANLAVAAVLTESSGHAEALYGLLLPYASLYAVDIRLHSDGSVAHYLGLLARSLGKKHEAVAHLEDAFERNSRADLPARAAHSAYELALALRETSPDQEKRVRELFDRALSISGRIGMDPLARSVRRALGAA